MQLPDKIIGVQLLVAPLSLLLPNQLKIGQIQQCCTPSPWFTCFCLEWTIFSSHLQFCDTKDFQITLPNMTGRRWDILLISLQSLYTQSINYVASKGIHRLLPRVNANPLHLSREINKPTCLKCSKAFGDSTKSISLSHLWKTRGES